jgi:predicted metal-binding protein
MFSLCCCNGRLKSKNVAKIYHVSLTGAHLNDLMSFATEHCHYIDKDQVFTQENSAFSNRFVTNDHNSENYFGEF